MHIHMVFFWLKPGTDLVAFEAAVADLTTMAMVREGHVGIPAATGSRAVVDDSYDVALTLLFDDLAAHDTYQTDPAHTAFVEANHNHWTRVQVYDVQTR